MKRLLLFLARLIVISLLFVPVLSPLHTVYKFIVVLLSNAALPTKEMIAALPYDGSGYLYTFLTLILGVPNLAIRKRIFAIVIGICLFIGADCFMAGIWIPYLKTPRPSLVNMAVSYSWIVVVHYLLPFLLWLAFSFRQIEKLFKGQKLNETT